MIRRPPRSTPLYSSAASDVYKRQITTIRETFESKSATRVTATDKRKHACGGRWPVLSFRDAGKKQNKNKTPKEKKKKGQTCAPGVHVDYRSVNSRPNAEGVNKTVNTPGVKRDFSTYAFPKIHFISSIPNATATLQRLSPLVGDRQQTTARPPVRGEG